MAAFDWRGDYEQHDYTAFSSSIRNGLLTPEETPALSAPIHTVPSSTNPAITVKTRYLFAYEERGETLRNRLA